MFRSVLGLFCLLFTVSSFGSIRQCEPDYLSLAYSEAHAFAAIEGAPYALMANNAYPDQMGPKFRLPTNWQALHLSLAESLTGFSFSVFQRNWGENQEIIIAFRGTDDLLDWWHGGITGEQYQQALTLAQAIKQLHPTSRLTVTGHSLGGGLALHVSMKMEGVAAYAFNPSPIIHAPVSPKKNRRVVYWEYDDPLHLGRKWLMQSPDTVFWKFDFVKRNGHRSEALSKGLLMLAATKNEELREVLRANCQLDPLSL